MPTKQARRSSTARLVKKVTSFFEDKFSHASTLGVGRLRSKELEMIRMGFEMNAIYCGKQ